MTRLPERRTPVRQFDRPTPVRPAPAHRENGGAPEISGAPSPAFRVVPTTSDHAETLAALQITVFPKLAPSERFTARHYRRHIEVFPDGQLVAVPTEGDPAPVASTTTLRVHLDLDHPNHTFREAIGDLSLGNHRDDGPWLYGADLGVRPDWRRRGIARALYDARRAAARRLGLEGEATVGLLNGFGAMADQISIADYYRAVVSRRLLDPTVSMQLHLGFQARALLPGYVDDTRCRGYGVLLIRPT